MVYIRKKYICKNQIKKGIGGTKEVIDFIKKKNTKFTSFKKNKDVTNLNDKCWERLKSMAFETYVPESETSKSGAGY